LALGSGMQIPLDLIDDTVIDGKQPGFVKLRLSNEQRRILTVIVAQKET
jgi:hypothetical protein